MSPPDACTHDCPLCGDKAGARLVAQNRRFSHCPGCDLIWADAAERIDAEAQRRRYLLHENSLENAGYRLMLESAIAMLARHGLRTGRVLDYGCGAVPLLAQLLAARGYEPISYDPLFAPNADLSRSFDAIISIETFEHFEQPAQELRRLTSLLSPAGLLVIRTLFHHGPESLARWWYIRDPTHVSFYSELTFGAIGRHFPLELVEISDQCLAVFRAGANAPALTPAS